MRASASSSIGCSPGIYVRQRPGQPAASMMPERTPVANNREPRERKEGTVMLIGGTVDVMEGPPGVRVVVTRTYKVDADTPRELIGYDEDGTPYVESRVDYEPEPVAAPA